MIVKSFEILKNPLKFFNYNLFLLYGENEGIKKDIVKNIKNIIIQNKTNDEFISLFEDEISANVENFYDSVKIFRPPSGSKNFL